MIGQTISHYKILEKLGGGGMGVVYKGFDLKLERLVALKFLYPNLAASERAKKRFMAEARAASALDHPNIGTIHEIDESPDGSLFIVMAYYPGETLRQRLDRRPLSIEDALEVAIQTARGLSKAHQHGIVHRDVKPANIILTEEGVAKIVDFGLAKVVDVHLTDAGTLVGTPSYMSPEQALGLPVDHRADIWALGVLLYEMLTGRTPFEGNSREEILRLASHVEPPPMTLPSGGLEALEAVVKRALAKTAHERYQTMAEVLEELERVRAGVPAQSLMQTMDAPRVRPSPKRPSSYGTGERRQLTFLCCDLADFSAAGEIDPEDLQELLSAYQKACEDVVRPLEGLLAHVVEDRVTVHFGFPHAHEDDAKRAVSAGRNLLQAISHLSQSVPALKGRPLEGRVGIHTGVVVTGTDDSGAVVGPATRLSSLVSECAEPGEILVTEDTYRLIRSHYMCEPRGTRTLRGVKDPVVMYRVVGESLADSISLSPVTDLTELVGRRAEVELLLDRWAKAKEGMGQVVMLSGEPGIGKSRLGHVLKGRLAEEPHFRLECHGSPQHVNSPLHPVTSLLSRAVDLRTEMAGEEKLERLRAFLQNLDASSGEDLAVFASLLSIPLPADSPAPHVSPQKWKQKTLAALLKIILASASRKPVLLWVEDLHWIDPTTQELLGLVIDQAPTAALLALLTFRPEFLPPWGNRAHLTQVTLTRLSREEAEGLVKRVAGGKTLPREIVTQILATADGVPLFVEELTKNVLESGLLTESGERFELRGNLASLAIPATLQGSLMARLDRLGTAKDVAQWGAALGREFHYEWLEAVSPYGEGVLEKELTRLVKAELLFQKGVLPEARYTFKHALVKDAAYQSLLKATRQQIHERIARVLTERFPETAEAQPELLAHHFTEAGLAEPAADAWTRAAQRAFQGSNHVETIAQAAHGLEMVARLPDGTERDRREIFLQHLLGSATGLSKGYGDSQLEASFVRMRELCQRSGTEVERFDALTGLAGFYLLRADFDKCAEAGEQALALAESMDATDLRINIHYVLGMALLYRGALEEARAHLERGIELGGAGPTRVVRAGHDFGVTILCGLAITRWLQGYADEAHAHMTRALSFGRESSYAYSRAYALFHAAFFYQFRREPDTTLELAAEAVAVSEEHGLFWGVTGQALHAWARLQMKPATEDATPELGALVQSVAFLIATGTRLTLAVFFKMQAESFARHGARERSLESLERAFEVARETGERFYEAELHRLSGELALSEDKSRAYASFQKGLDAARAVGARALELRVATSLARLERAQGKTDEARRLLSETYGLFTEGFETPDLKEARELLDALS